MDNKELMKKLFIAYEEDVYNSLTDVAEYQNISNQEKIAEEVLINSISHDAFHLYDKVATLRNEMASLEVEEGFIKGVSITIQLLIEALKL